MWDTVMNNYLCDGSGCVVDQINWHTVRKNEA